jgi:N-methylhydantoinase A
MLRVGPKSAGANPGPACYGRGGTDATVTDANVVLGRINPDYFLGGRIKLDAAAAHAAVKRIGDALGMTTDDVAFAIVEIINNNMNGALRTVLRQRGLDPREFSLVASGGAGPVHTCDLMTMANIPRSIVPNFPGQFSAFGFIMTDARVDRQRTARQTSRAFDMARATRAMTDLVGGAVAELKQQGYTTGIAIHRSIEARYLGQNHELEVTFPSDVFDERTTQDLWDRFHTEHEARFGFAIPGETIETVNLKAVVVASDRKPTIRQVANSTGAPKSTGRRRVRFADAWLEIPVYNRDHLNAGNELTGPAVIEENASVTILNAGQMLSIDKWGNMIITMQAQH